MLTPRIIIIVGDVFNGLKFIGPFISPKIATEYAAVRFARGTWHVVRLEQPMKDAL
jgi:hypothetical protein